MLYLLNMVPKNTFASARFVERKNGLESVYALPSIPMLSRKSLQGARAAQIQSDTRRVVDCLIEHHIRPTAVNGETRATITVGTVSHVTGYMTPRPLVMPTLVEIQEVMAKVLPDVDVYVVTQLNHPDATTTTRLDILTVDWS